MSKKTAVNRGKLKNNIADENEQSEYHPYRVHLPGFVRNEDIGLGDVIKRATSYVGITSCGGCEKRAAVLNRWMAFAGRRSQNRSTS